MTKIFDNTTRIWLSIAPTMLVSRADIAEVSVFFSGNRNQIIMLLILFYYQSVILIALFNYNNFFSPRKYYPIIMFFWIKINFMICLNHG